MGADFDSFTGIKKVQGLRAFSPDWPGRLALYLILFVFVITISHILFSFSGFPATDSAIYTIGILIISETVGLSLVIIVSFLALHTAASSFSIRVVTVFRHAPDLWILSGTYIAAIIYSLTVLELTGQPNFAFYINFSYYLGIFAFAALIPYIWNLFNLLEPLSMIRILSGRITTRELLQSFAGEKPDDPLEPIVDIVISALMKHDLHTLQGGLRTITLHSCNMLDKSKTESIEEKKIARHIFSHLIRIGRLSVSKKELDATLEVMDNISVSGITAAKSGLESCTGWAAVALGETGASSARQKLEIETYRAVEYIEEVGSEAVQNKLENAAKQAIESIGRIGIAAARQELEIAAWHSSRSLGVVGAAAAKQSFHLAAQWAAVFLGMVGVEAVKHNLENSAREVPVSLYDIGAEAINLELVNAVQEVIVSLRLVGSGAAEHERGLITRQVVDSLGSIGVMAAAHKMEQRTRQAVESLGWVGRAAVSHQLEESTREAIKSIETIGAAAANEKLFHASQAAGDYLEFIGKAAIDHDMADIKQLSDESIDKLKAGYPVDK